MVRKALLKFEFGLMTDHPVALTRQLFIQTRWFVRAGMSKFFGLQKANQLI
jgi:hypothetical protein